MKNMEEESSEDTQTSEFTHEYCNNIGNEMILSNENYHTLLYSGRKFESWEACENFIIIWAKQQGFRIIKDRVVRLEGIIRRRTYICSHSRTYESNSTRDTVTKKIGCPFVVNASCPKLKNPEEYVIINKIVEQHNHPLDVSIVEFEDSRKFTDSMIEDIKFMTVSCKFGATAQRKFLEGKYPTHPLYSRELYNTIQRFRPTKESLLNNAAKLSNWLDSQKEIDSHWLIFRGWDEDNTLTHLSWMTPYQVENWVKYSDCVINDVTHKTNRYGMALSLIVGFNNDRKNLILAQGLLIDESLDSHIWMFNNIVEATGIRPVVIITDSDPAVDAAIRQVFTSTYPIHCAFHISHNLDKNLRKLLANDYQSFIHSFYSCRNCITESIFQQRFEKLIEDYPKAKNYLEHLYKTKSYWAHCYTKYQFTGGMIASSRVESVNACLKRLLNNSNTPLYDLMIEIQRLLDYQDKEKEYEFWRLSIPHIRNQNDMNFLFSKIDQCLQEFLTPTILKMHRNEMNQSLYYVANQLIQDVDVHEEESFEVTTEQLSSDIPNATLNQLIKFVGSPNIREIWTIKVGNSLDIKHHVLLLQNRGYLCSCLSIVQNGIVCRHYFQVMLVTKTAFFHIQFIPSRWYDDNKDVKKAMQEPFLVADKFIQENITYNYDGFSDSNMTLCLFNQYNNEFCEDRLTIMEQKLIYGKLHGMYKKALNKALGSNSKSEQLINLLQEFTEDGESDFKELNEINETNPEDEIIDKENVDPLTPILRNPKKRSGKGRPLGTKRFKSSTEAPKPKSRNQRNCRKYGKVGHYQKNCKEQEI